MFAKLLEKGMHRRAFEQIRMIRQGPGFPRPGADFLQGGVGQRRKGEVGESQRSKAFRAAPDLLFVPDRSILQIGCQKQGMLGDPALARRECAACPGRRG